ncbi:MAG: glycine cleavage system protein GcvH [Verrucomicrobiota bacterium]|nr:glycine cleavage system protein GcvH [Verrucomicrobiota bacterium]
MTPDDRKYTKTHEWVKIEDDLAVVGITDYAQESLGDIAFVELPAAGDAFKQGEECGVIESVKAAGDLFSPIAGEIAEVNTTLEDKPETINASPYDAGWIFKAKNFDGAEVAGLMDADQYEALLENDE